MDKKLAREHLTQIKRAIIDLGYDCMEEWFAINSKYSKNKYKTNYELYDDTSRMMCKARHRIFS